MRKHPIFFTIILTILPLYDLLAWVYVWNSMPNSTQALKREEFYRYLPIENFETVFHIIIVGLCLLAIITLGKNLNKLPPFSRVAGLFLMILNVLLLLLKLWSIL